MQGRDRLGSCKADTHGREPGSVLRVREFRDEQGRAALGDGDTEADEETTGDEHVDVDARSLQSYTEQHDDTSDNDAHSATESICNLEILSAPVCVVGGG